MKIIST